MIFFLKKLKPTPSELLGDVSIKLLLAKVQGHTVRVQWGNNLAEVLFLLDCFKIW